MCIDNYTVLAVAFDMRQTIDLVDMKRQNVASTVNKREEVKDFSLLLNDHASTRAVST